VAAWRDGALRAEVDVADAVRGGDAEGAHYNLPIGGNSSRIASTSPL
jgi:hypothetical protein